jgi:HupE / UreJ protein
MMMRQLIAIALLWLTGLSGAHAHPMVAQLGTLNLVDNGAFMVLSVPVSALTGTDDDSDGKLSMAELLAHRDKVIASVKSQIQLVDEHGPRPLEGLMLTLSPSDDAPAAPASQLIVMGRFALADKSKSLRLHLGLFGKDAAEQNFQVTVTRSTEKQLLVLNPDRAVRALFPSSWAVLADYVALGAEHIVTGLDHLLFLLVVLSAGWGWRHVWMALTAFTAGHAITLMASVWGGITVPAMVVEPTIAATVVGIAAFDLYARRRDRLPSPWVRLALVFGCALVHGLGLASSLTELGLDRQHQLQSLVGFNVGIELGQLAVALVAAVITGCIQRFQGARGVAFATRLASLTAMSAGSVWFVQRVVVPA